MTNKTTKTNALANITSTTLVDALRDNRKFGATRINADQIGAEGLRVWHNALDNVLSACYKIVVTCHNTCGDGADLTPIYDAIRPVLATLGKVNGAKIKADGNTATTLLTFCSRGKTVYSPEMSLARQTLSSYKKMLSEYEALNGTSEESKKNLREVSIPQAEAEVERLSKIENSVRKEFTMANKTSFYGLVERFICDRVEDHFAQTEEEIKAEAEAKRQARNKKNNAKKAKKVA